MKQTVFSPADILLPKQGTDMHKWSVVACDQYTSESAYWDAVADTVGNAPSALHIILPELYLGKEDTDARIAKIGEAMRTYEKDVLISYPETMIYVERQVKNGKIRHGLVGKIDLEAYDYNKGSTSAIRATEGTVLSRIPPRVRIRKDACLEAPHVMILVNDPENLLFAEAEKAKGNGAPVYDFDLMQNGGHIAGWTLDGERLSAVDTVLAKLGDEKAFRAQYGDRAPLLLAVGDGNHSLATAKACYELVKDAIGAEAAKNHPARYALAEIVNIHDEALEFEPIYRVLFGVNPDDVIGAMHAYYPALTDTAVADGHNFTWISADRKGTLGLANPEKQLPVGTLQDFLDAYLEAHPTVKIDYIHGEASVRGLTASPDAMGFLFEGMTKDMLFRTVICDGALPRKTFSMGEADEKRYYLECRKIR